MARWQRWHRRTALVAVLGLLVWATSGILHPFLSRYQPRPATAAAPPVALPATAVPMATVLARHGIARLQRIRTVAWDERVYYQVITRADTPPRYFAVDSGDERPRADAAYARFLAGHFLGAPLADDAVVIPVTAFDDDYHATNRFLPVHRVATGRADGLRVYVHTPTSQLATLVDARKARYTWWFTTLHNWRFLGSNETLRVTVMSGFVLAVIATPLLGLALGYHARRSRRGTAARRWHRRLGLAVALSLLASATSGAWHLLAGAARGAADAPGLRHAWPALPAAALTWTEDLPRTTGEIAAIACDGHLYLRQHAALPAAAPHAHHGHGAPPAGGPAARYVAAAASAPAGDDIAYARALAGHFSGLPAALITDVTPVTAFGGEYGFINKLLPVFRVAYATARGDRYFVHLDSAALAAHVDARAYAEGWTFAHLHKWQWLEGIGRWPRDLVLMGFTLAAVVAAGLGLRLSRRRRAAPRQT